MSDITLSVVLYRDYDTPLEMIRSLSEYLPSSYSVRLYAVDNSGVESPEKDMFLATLKSYPFVEYLDAESNLGFGAANNLALEKADSKYHVFVNPDIQFTSDALSALASFMDAHDEIGMCIPRMVDEEGNLLPVYRREVTVLDAFNRMFLKGRLAKREAVHTMAGEDYSKPFRVPFGQGSFLFGKTDLLKEIGGFDDRFFMYLEDADLCKRINGISSLWYCPDVKVIHKWERGSHKKLRLMKIHLASYWKYFKKWNLSLR